MMVVKKVSGNDLNLTISLVRPNLACHGLLRENSNMAPHQEVPLTSPPGRN